MRSAISARWLPWGGPSFGVRTSAKTASVEADDEARDLLGADLDDAAEESDLAIALQWAAPGNGCATVLAAMQAANERDPHVPGVTSDGAPRHADPRGGGWSSLAPSLTDAAAAARLSLRSLGTNKVVPDPSSAAAPWGETQSAAASAGGVSSSASASGAPAAPMATKVAKSRPTHRRSATQ